MVELLDWTRARSPGGAWAWALVVNWAVFFGALLVGQVLTRAFQRSPVGQQPEALSRAEVTLAVLCVLGNSLVMWLGWLLFRAGWLKVVGNASGLAGLRDALLLVLIMDLAMYLAHRIAHHPLAFRYVHGVHHRYERVRPLTLFALHPLEVLGFGGLWLSVLLLHPFSLLGMVLYLTVNTLFGVFGHLGVEPFPARFRALPLARAIGTSTFHAQHHQEPRSNFGFYTNLWDRLFRTLDPRGLVGQATRPNHRK